MRIAVFGATGPTGRLFTEQALAAGHEVTASVRHPDAFELEHERLRVLTGDATDRDAVAAAVAGQDAVVSALGVPYSRTPISLYSQSAALLREAMGSAGVRRLVAVTSTNVDTSAGSQGLFVFDHVVEPVLSRVVGRTLYADMRRMEQVVRDSDLEWTIVRPAALCASDTVSDYAVAETFVRGRFTARRDLAAFMLAELDDQRFVRRVAAVTTPSAAPSVLGIIWRDGLRPMLPKRLTGAR